MNFCLGTGVDGPLITISRKCVSPRFLRSAFLMETFQYWSNTMSTLWQSSKYFVARSPNAAAPVDFVAWISAIPSIKLATGMSGHLGSLGSMASSLSKIESRTLLVVFRKLPSVCSSEKGTEESSKLRTSFRSTSRSLVASNRRPNKSLSAPMVTIFSFAALTVTFFTVKSKVLILKFGSGAQKLTSFEFKRFSMNVLICVRPAVVL